MINSRSLDDLHPKARAICEKLILNCKLNGIDIIVTSTYRDFEYQDFLYAKGRTTKGENCTTLKPLGNKVTGAKAGFSFHNFRVAFDVVPVNPSGKPVWDNMAMWDEIGEIGEMLGLTWGGNFKSFKDRPHFELTNGLTLKDFQSGKTLQ